MAKAKGKADEKVDRLGHLADRLEWAIQSFEKAVAKFETAVGNLPTQPAARKAPAKKVT